MNHIPVELNDFQRGNLVKLAAYLRTLPADYPDFAMRTFIRGVGGRGESQARVPECGTAACAVGHGPAAGILPEYGETWMEYSVRTFVPDDYPNGDSWDWCFGSSWADIDNTAHGAAARIEYMLQKGVPENSCFQRWGEAPLSYAVPA